MSPDRISLMANQIARFFETQPGRMQAASVADHINAFWEPRMRVKLLTRIATGGEGLHPLVIEAGPRIRIPAQAASGRTEDDQSELNTGGAL